MFLLMLLSVVAYIDLKQRRIPLLCMIFGLLYWGMRIIYQFVICKNQIQEQVIGDVFVAFVIIGICLIMRYIRKESIGIGDVLLLGSMTLIGGRKVMAVTFVFTLVYLFVVSIILLTGGYSKKSTLPFAPFLWMGYMTWILIHYIK